ncbi:MAG: 4a-hydroxytetrahydrobiopterin dehydratase [Egibacteraceae bacterium]
MSSAQDLATRTCGTCAPGTAPLDDAHAAELAAGIHPAWEREGTARIRRTVRFPNFRDAFAVATKIALLAESQGHHPDLEVGWARLAVTFTTHAAGGLTENDFVMAAKIDRFLPAAA